MSEPFLGQLACFGFNFAPAGWAQCDGQLLSIAQNSALFSLFGTMYGGDGETTFGLPDLRGRTPLHAGQGPGLPNVIQGSSAGSPSTVLNVSNLPPHTHTAQLNAVAGNASETAPAANGLATAREDTYASGVSSVAMSSSSVSIANTGSGQAFDNYSPYQALNWCVALIGIYPSN